MKCKLIAMVNLWHTHRGLKALAHLLFEVIDFKGNYSNFSMNFSMNFYIASLNKTINSLLCIPVHVRKIRSRYMDSFSKAQ